MIIGCVDRCLDVQREPRPAEAAASSPRLVKVIFGDEEASYLCAENRKGEKVKTPFHRELDALCEACGLGGAYAPDGPMAHWCFVC